jgi:hypothetical protein
VNYGGTSVKQKWHITEMQSATNLKALASEPLGINIFRWYVVLINDSRRHNNNIQVCHGSLGRRLSLEN